MNKASPKILLFHGGKSQYDILEVFANFVAHCFVQLGCQVRPFNVNAPDPESEINALIKEGFTFAFCFNGIRIDADVNGKSLFDFLQAPLLAMLVDHPIYHRSLIEDRVKNLCLTCVDKSHLDFINDQFQNMRSVDFLPHGACHSPKAPSSENLKSIDLLFGGTLLDPDLIFQEILQCPQEVRAYIDSTIECLQQGGVSIEEAINEVWGDVDNKDYLFNKFLRFLPQADLFVRMRRRHQVLETVAQGGLSLVCSGKGPGWECVKWKDLKNVTFLNNVSFPDMLEHMTKSRMVLNVMPGFTQGSHERVLSAAINGALPVTDRSTWLEENFDEGNEIIFYSPQKLDELVPYLQSLLEKPNLIEERAYLIQNKVQSSHTWMSRTKEILQWYQKLASDKML